jgi:hypothetical protein
MASAPKLLGKGSTVTLAGQAMLLKTDAGWRVQGLEIEAAQIIPPSPLEIARQLRAERASYLKTLAGSWQCNGITLRIHAVEDSLRIQWPGGDLVSSDRTTVHIPAFESIAGYSEQGTLEYNRSPIKIGGLYPGDRNVIAVNVPAPLNVDTLLADRPAQST